ncbi:hypothetical protein C2845_PM09G03070 [Panicum miliaceum]|uniref:Uncharacterized protein n=1 Tax=Panicum miliaceum TaxID=4540 RepID=A0A3L6S1Y6_PANMI|nr:hypothetical protein C2845_PM09G03070 [Panicum miliaceum]
MLQDFTVFSPSARRCCSPSISWCPFYFSPLACVRRRYCLPLRPGSSLVTGPAAAVAPHPRPDRRCCSRTVTSPARRRAQPARLRRSSPTAGTTPPCLPCNPASSPMAGQAADVAPRPRPDRRHCFSPAAGQAALLVPPLLSRGQLNAAAPQEQNLRCLHLTSCSY